MKGVEPIIEILAKPLFVYHLLKRLIGGSDDPGMDIYFFIAADSFHNKIL